MVSGEQTNKKVHWSARNSTLSIIFGVISFAVLGVPLGIASTILGAIAITRDKDKFGYIGIILGIFGAISTTILVPMFL